MNDRLLNIKQVKAEVSMCKSTIYKLIKKGEFPSPLKPAPRISRWRMSEIQDYKDALEAARLDQTELYRHYDKEDNLLYIGVSLSTLKRLLSHKDRSGWFHSISRVEIERFETREIALEAEKKAIRKEKPAHNIQHNG